MYMCLQIGTPSHVFLFDVLTLGVDCFNEGLKEILENENILKVKSLISNLMLTLISDWIFIILGINKDNHNISYEPVREKTNNLGSN